jgi:nucleoside 2-deoxyribosyltransferase
MKIYAPGAIYGGTDKIETYKKLIRELEKYGEVLNKQIADENTIENEKYQKDTDIFEDLEEKMKIADIVFAEVSVTSLGVGYELGYTDMLGKKIIAIYDETYTKKVTTMIRGNKRIKLVPYKDLNEIIDKLPSLLEKEK